jgi:hypothetical protein
VAVAVELIAKQQVEPVVQAAVVLVDLTLSESLEPQTPAAAVAAVVILMLVHHLHLAATVDLALSS